MLYNIFIFLHVLFCLSIIILILMQDGKGAEVGSSFNNISQNVFGNKGSKSFFVKLTTFMTILFFVNCFIISVLNHNFQSKNVINILDSKEKTNIQKNNEIENLTLDDIPMNNFFNDK